MFSLFSSLLFPVLLLDHPKAVLRAFEATLGLAGGNGSPTEDKTFSFSSTDSSRKLTKKGVSGFKGFKAGTGDMTLLLIGFSCNGAAVASKERLMLIFGILTSIILVKLN